MGVDGLTGFAVTLGRGKVFTGYPGVTSFTLVAPRARMLFHYPTCYRQKRRYKE